MQSEFISFWNILIVPKQRKGISAYKSSGLKVIALPQPVSLSGVIRRLSDILASQKIMCLSLPNDNTGIWPLASICKMTKNVHR